MLKKIARAVFGAFALVMVVALAPAQAQGVSCRIDECGRQWERACASGKYGYNNTMCIYNRTRGAHTGHYGRRHLMHGHYARSHMRFGQRYRHSARVVHRQQVYRGTQSVYRGQTSVYRGTRYVNRRTGETIFVPAGASGPALAGSAIGGAAAPAAYVPRSAPQIDDDPSAEDAAPAQPQYARAPTQPAPQSPYKYVGDKGDRSYFEVPMD